MTLVDDPTAIACREITVALDGTRVLDRVSVTVGRGEWLMIVGPNGAGKTTLLRALARVHRQASGTVRYGDTDLMKLSADRVARQGISMVRDGARVFESLTIEEHLYLALRLERSKTGKSSTVDDVLEKFPVLARRGRGVKAGYLSGGQRQALCLAMAVGAGARFLLLDEPSAGLAESTAEETFALIASLARQGVSMLIAEQQPRWLSGWTTATVRLEMGRVASLTRG
jgi:branched-chain amino acid transport system ATP-binding protein